MPRTARIVVPGAPHHVVQRGTRRQQTFFSDADYSEYLNIAADSFGEAGVEVWAYCLMPNHVHLIAVPNTLVALSNAVGATHLRYTRLLNRRSDWKGSLWQGRFGSSAMDDRYFIACARYIALNPVRAGLAKSALSWPWSSVRAHLHGVADPLLTREPLVERLGPGIGELFDADFGESALEKLRSSLASGRPLRAVSTRTNAPATARGHVPKVHVPG